MPKHRPLGLPNRGGGAETYIDALEPLEGFEHRRVELSSSRSPVGVRCPRSPRSSPQVARAPCAGRIWCTCTATPLRSSCCPCLFSVPAVPPSTRLLSSLSSFFLSLSLPPYGRLAAPRRSAFVICTPKEERSEPTALMPQPSGAAANRLEWRGRSRPTRERESGVRREFGAEARHLRGPLPREN